MEKLYIPPSIFIDTNVLLDQLQLRAGMKSAEKILNLGKDRVLRLCMSTLTVVNVAYIMRKMMPLDQIKKIFKDWLRDYIILPNNDANVYTTCHGNHPDFEDAMQLDCAESGHCVAIVTNNKKHFEPYTDMPVLTPDEFLARITGKE